MAPVPSPQEVTARIEQVRRRRPRFTDDHVTMAHGAGGKASRQLVEGLVVPLLEDPELDRLGDAADIGRVDGRVVLTTDAFVVRPLQFPGGSIGELAVNGTVNDLAVSGARPLVITLAMVLEEGLPAGVLEREVRAAATAAAAAGVRVVAGDTKVVERGKADGMYLVTTGVGVAPDDLELGPERVALGDRVLVSGPIGDHGIAILLARGELDLSADVRSDTQPLWAAVEALLAAAGRGLRCLRDATRGGVATVLNEIAMGAEVSVHLDEAAVPVRPVVRGAGELLGIDPLYVANEGRLVAFVAPDVADDALAALRRVPGCEDAALVGEVSDEPAGCVLGRTEFGGHRMIDVLVGDPLPRIC